MAAFQTVESQDINLESLQPASVDVLEHLISEVSQCISMYLIKEGISMSHTIVLGEGLPLCEHFLSL